jgi:hypothetical protein
MENSHTMRLAPGSSVKVTSKRAKSLRLGCGRGLEADLERLDRLRPHRLHGTPHRRIGASEAALAQLAPQPGRGQPGIGGQPLAQIRQEGIGAFSPAFATGDPEWSK